MSLPRYSEYKDSGAPWLGSVPRHWNVQRFKWLINRNDGGVWGDDPDGVDDTIVLRSTEQTVDGQWQIDEPAKRKLTEKERGSALLEKGDLLLTKSSGSALHIGKTTLVDECVADLRACYSNFMQRLRVEDVLCPKIAWYILNNGLARVQLDLLSNSTTGLANLNGTIIGELLVALPPHEEQTAIARFLDRETAKIDALIAEQEKLIVLLAEKRQATISHAVTKGLKPNALMKDSGMAWMGEVPAHWDVTRIKYVVEKHDGIQMGPFGGMLLELDAVDTGFKVYGQENTISGDFFLGHRWISEVRFRELERYRIQIGDLVLTRKGSLGNARLVQELPQPGICDSDTIRVRVSKQFMRPEFFATLLHEAEYVAIQLAMAKRGAILSGVNTETIANLYVVAPPPSEQDEILKSLSARLANFKSVTDSVAKAIALLKERRSALIAAAVTGQIDVRGAGTQAAADSREAIAA